MKFSLYLYKRMIKLDLILILLLLIPVVVLLLIYFPTNHFFSNQYDDGYITYRYAINLAKGYGIVFNLGELTDSASSFLYTIILAIFYKFGFKDLEFIGALIGVISLEIVVIYVYKIAYYLTNNKSISLIVSMATGLNGFLSGWALSGMETLPWSALIILAIYLMIINANYILISLTIVAASLTRFEGILLIIPYIGLLLTRSQQKKQFILLMLVIFIFMLFYIIKYEYYGVWISHAFKVKKLITYYHPNPKELLLYWFIFGSIPLLIGWFVLIKKHFSISLYVFISFIVLIFGPRSDFSRYSVHLLPLLYSFSAVALVKIQLTHQNLLKIAILLLMLQAIAGEKFNWNNMTDLAEHQICRKQLGIYIKNNIPNDQYIASSDIGAIAYSAINHKFVDLLGLTSSDVLANYSIGKTADDILINKRVKYIADTFHENNKPDHINRILLTLFGIHKKSNFRTFDQKDDFSCRTDSLYFKLLKISHMTTNK